MTVPSTVSRVLITLNKIKLLFTIIWITFIFFVFQNFIIEAKQINWNDIFASKVLLDTCQKCLCEVESGNPKRYWRGCIKPVLKHFTEVNVAWSCMVSSNMNILHSAIIEVAIN